jgi:hypothetical protein
MRNKTMLQQNMQIIKKFYKKKCSLMVSALSSWMLLHRSRAGGFLLHHHSVWCCYQIEFRPRCLQESAMKPAFNIKKPSQILYFHYDISFILNSLDRRSLITFSQWEDLQTKNTGYYLGWSCRAGVWIKHRCNSNSFNKEKVQL